MIVWVVVGLLLITMLFFFYASYSIRSGIYLNALCKNPDAGKVVALTFDDGPHPIQTPKVLDILKKHNIKVCFFCIGNRIEGNESIIQRIKNEGHLLGNHSHSHSGKFPLYSIKRIVNDTSRCSERIEDITGDKVLLFRPPFGVTNPTIARMVKKHNYITVGWNIRTLDTCKNSEKVLQRIEKKLSPGSVILLHDNLQSSDRVLEKVIDLIINRGYKFTRVDELFNLNLEA